MTLSEDDLTWLVGQGLLADDQATAIRQALLQRQRRTAHPAPAWRARFDLLHVAYYFGALLVIGAMGFFMTVAWEAIGGGGIAAVAATYAIAFVVVGQRLWRQGLLVPGGLLITMAVGMVPLATFGLQRAIGWWPTEDPGSFRDFYGWARSGWLVMEATTIAAAAIALRWFRFPFLTAPLAFALWYVAMDATPLIAGEDLQWQARGWVSLSFGLATVALGRLVEQRLHRDFGFWLYLFGQLAFWGGLTTVAFGSESGWLPPLLKTLTGLLGLGAIVLGTRRDQVVFTVFGVYGMLVLAVELLNQSSVAGNLAAMAYGALIIALAFLGDQANRSIKSGFGYLVGATVLFVGMAQLTFFAEPQWQKALFVPGCLLAMVTAVILQRRVFVIYGAVGLFSYLGYLATEIFADSLLFPFVISGIGLGIIALAVAYRRHQERWRQALLKRLPSGLAARLPTSETR